MRMVGIATTALFSCLSTACTVDTQGTSLRSAQVDLAEAEFPYLSFPGVRSAATADTPVTIASTDFYDPQRTRYDLLHVVGVFFWCPHCNNETSALVRTAAWQAEHRVAVLQIAFEGYGSNDPTWDELQRWVASHATTFPVVIDEQGKLLGQYFPVGSVPLNIVVDPASMRVLAADIGEVGDVQAYEQKFLAAL